MRQKLALFMFFWQFLPLSGKTWLVAGENWS
jgi:hypothetical protein